MKAQADPTSSDASGRGARLPEMLLALAIVAGVLQVTRDFYKTGYLPQPFIYDTNGTFMDWINPAYWAHHPGAFDVWQSVYPPLSFVFLRIFSLGRCYISDSSTSALNCDWLSKSTIIIIYVINIYLTFHCYWKSNRRTAIFRTTAMALGLPMLYTLERGNLILPCYTFFLLGHARLIKSAWLRWLSVAMSINFKPYLIFAALPYAVRRRWRWLEGCGLATLLIYLLTYTTMGAGSPIELIQNQQGWLKNTALDHYWNIYYSTSYTSLVSAVNGDYPVLTFVDSRLLDVVTKLLPALIELGQVGVLASMAVAWFRPGAAPTYRLAALGLSLVLTASNPGGYTEVFLLFLVFLEPWRGVARVTALVAAYLSALPVDYTLVGLRGITEQSWLGHTQVTTNFGLSVGQLARPGLLLVIQFALVAATLFDAFRGWREDVASPIDVSSESIRPSTA